MKSEGKEVKQKIELINNDPCRISLTISSTDDKGKTTDEIYEFALSDMNKLTGRFKSERQKCGSDPSTAKIKKNLLKYIKTAHSKPGDLQIAEM